MTAAPIRVTPKGPADGGDFGPGTPGTRTAGIQEALDEAQAAGRELHIAGGPGGLHDGRGRDGNVYVTHETIRVPWSQDFTVTGGNYVLSYTGESGSALLIDSQMNCRYHFGLVVSPAPDPVVAIRPETPGPDDFVVVTASVFDFACVVSGHPQGTSILLNSRHGPIVNSRLFAEETNSQGTGLHLSDAAGSGHALAGNTIEILYGNQYHGVDDTCGLRLGEAGSRHVRHNRLALSFHAPRGAHFDADSRRYVLRDDVDPRRAVGAEIHGRDNELHLSFHGDRPRGQDVVFEADARDNTVHALNLPNGVTQRSRCPTNHVVTNGPLGFAVATPPVPITGEVCVNDTAFAMEAWIVEPGQVRAWTVSDAGAADPEGGNLSLVDDRLGRIPDAEPRAATAQTFAGGLRAGQAIRLDPGDAICFDYTDAPTWRWKALR